MAALDAFADRLLRHEPLAKYTAARLGGPADLLYRARESLEELAAVVRAAWTDGVPVRVLGGGANVLVSDDGVPGLVVINHVSHIDIGEDCSVTAASGTSLTILARRCAAAGLTGFEWAISVPGTVGGAVVNNAGAHGGDMAASVRQVLVLEPDSDQPRTMSPADLAYGYRTSSLKARIDRRFLVLSARLQFERGDPEAIASRMEANIAHRKRTQPQGASLGSIFKNPPGDFAGRLIEAAGLKGYQIGGAQVSPVHANFFINRRSATAADYFQLIEHVRAVVLRETGVELELEIETLGQWS
ncbi:MAG: UDP-N-acetylmuramate dehydrogenase [Chloroflexota bacterium]|nr:MAG: hypothetical protein DIU68_14130 [Chloroflexota bacterium]